MYGDKKVGYCDASHENDTICCCEVQTTNITLRHSLFETVEGQ